MLFDIFNVWTYNNVMGLFKIKRKETAQGRHSGITKQERLDPKTGRRWLHFTILSKNSNKRFSWDEGKDIDPDPHSKNGSTIKTGWQW